MVLDHSRVSDVREGAWTDVLWIVEQSPGQCEHADVSGFLQTHGYWASYNIPYLEAIYDRLGYAKKKERRRRRAATRTSTTTTAAPGHRSSGGTTQPSKCRRLSGRTITRTTPSQAATRSTLSHPGGTFPAIPVSS